MSYNFVALFMFGSMIVLFLTGQRVFAVIGFVGSLAGVLLWGTGGTDMPFGAAIKLMNWYQIACLPAFVWMGYIMSETKMADELYRMFHVWFGPVPGGLAIGTVFLMIMIAAMNGLSVAGLAIGATIALPEMLRRNYDKVMITGIIQGGASLGILMPPSVVLVLYAMIARQPVGNVWLAGVVPGLLMAGIFVIYVLVRTTINPKMGPALSVEERAEITWGERFRLLGAGFMPVIIFGGMIYPFINGWASLVEASVIGALLSTAVAAVRGRINLRVLDTCMTQTLGVSCMFMWILMAAMAFGAVFDGLGAVKAIEGLFLQQFNLGPWGILIAMQLSFLLMGMFLDDTAMLIIVAPLYIPLVLKLDLGLAPTDVLIWYGILYTMTCQIAYMTPPFGYNLFLMRAMAPKNITLADIYRSIFPIVMLMLTTLIIVMIFPEIALWLPHQIYGYP